MRADGLRPFVRAKGLGEFDADGKALMLFQGGSILRFGRE